ncbi:MAG: ABC transporter substrate-binding protein [Oryzomonas sp.]|jgi:ABC-type nitrate/sulfonate/bicarbonate transport system substrate-binding protein
MKTSMVMGAVTLIVIVVLAGVGWHLAHKKRPADTLVTIRSSVSAAPTNFELVAKLTGKDIIKEEGVILKPTVVQAGGGGTVTMQALLGGNIDTAGGSVSIWVNAIGKGAKVKLLLPGTVTEEPEHSGLLVLEDSPIRTIEDLAGKKIAVNVLGAEADFIIRTFLKQHGLSVNQVKLLVVPAENEEQALRYKMVDAVAWTTSGGVPFERAVENGGVRRIPGTSSFEARGNKSLLTTNEGFREDFIREHPEAVRAYLKACDRAHAWYGRSTKKIRKECERCSEN